jgi:hypothetical protein
MIKLNQKELKLYGLPQNGEIMRVKAFKIAKRMMLAVY